MRWSIIRLIWVRELRDQLRDRRTLFMIAVLPIFLYPVLGFGLVQIAFSFLKKQSVVEVRGADNLPPPSPVPAASLFALTPPPPGAPLGGVERISSAFALARNRQLETPLDYPPLFVKEGERVRVPPAYFENPDEAKLIEFKLSDTPPPDVDPKSPEFFKKIGHTDLDSRQVDLILVVPSHFREDLEAAAQPKLFLLMRPGDDRSKLVHNRVSGILKRWRSKLAGVRLVRLGLPASYDEPFDIRDPEDGKANREKAAADLYDIFIRVLPLILVMWSLAGALYPAVDLCAGEKERGTMETLLISPASREEIVWGKFLTIWVFSAATALLNLLSMGVTTLQFSSMIQIEAFRPLALLWGVALLLPLSAFFSALCLAVGAYARSSKEGQYYLMPLFLVTMPLIFLTLAPDVTLNPFYSMVPITGAALLLQKLMAAGTPGGELYVYFIPVLGPLVVYSWLALRWAIEQFQREEVLFREAERLDIGLWLRNLFREKEPLPTTGEALFCFGVVLALSRFSTGFGDRLPLMGQWAVRYLAFVAAPPLFMALLLTKRPRQALGLRLPSWWAWPAAVAAAVLLFLPCVEYTRFILDMVPALKVSAEDNLRSFSDSLAPTPANGLPAWASRWEAFLVVVVLGSLCEELAFRGFILGGLRRHFRPWTAIFISSFLFGLAQMNVFQFGIHFVVGVVLGFLVVRGGSLLPAMLCHLTYNTFVYGPLVFPDTFGLLGYTDRGLADYSGLGDALAVVSLALAAGLMAAIAWCTRIPVARGEEDASQRPPAAVGVCTAQPAPAEAVTAGADGPVLASRSRS